MAFGFVVGRREEDDVAATNEIGLRRGGGSR
jgi:hypothetical protein